MRIDSHQHFWIYNKKNHQWIDDSMKKIRKNFLPSKLKLELKKNKIDGSVLIQVDQTEEENFFLLNQASNNSFIKGVVGWINLRDNKLSEKLDYYSQNPIFKGVRHIVQSEKDNFFSNQRFRDGIAQLSKFNLTYDILIYPRHLLSTIEMVKKLPNNIFILDHIGKPKISGEIDIKWKENIMELSKSENVYCKISGLVTECEQYKWKNVEFKPYLDHILNCFGTKRVMFGSDWPVCLVAADYNHVISIVKKYFKNFSKNELNQFFGLNCIKAYNI